MSNCPGQDPTAEEIVRRRAFMYDVARLFDRLKIGIEEEDGCGIVIEEGTQEAALAAWGSSYGPTEEWSEERRALLDEVYGFEALRRLLALENGLLELANKHGLYFETSDPYVGFSPRPFTRDDVVDFVRLIIGEDLPTHILRGQRPRRR